LIFKENRCVNLGKVFKKKKLLISSWTKYEKDNNGRSWPLLYGTKDDVK
jgi:hypothetical protein